MKAVQIVNPSEMKVVELEKPTVGAGEVLVRIKYVGFCGSDLNTFLGRNPMVKLPVIPGHEVGAVIEEVGPNVPAGFEKGMNVTLNPYTNCGKCASCRNGRVNACEHNETLGVQRNGVMCEYAVLPWTKIIPAGNISSRDCALIEPMSVGFHAVSRAQVIDNEYVMVIGCGMIGIGAIVRATLRGATVIAVDLDDEKLELAKRVGASHVINSKTENVHERMLTNGCSSLPLRQNLPPNPKRKPTMKQFAYSPKTSANFFSLRHWDKNGCSPSTPDSVPDVRWFVSTHKAICCIMRISIRILRSTRPARLLRNFAR